MLYIDQKNDTYELNSSNNMNYNEDYIDENSLWLVIKSLRHVRDFKVINPNPNLTLTSPQPQPPIIIKLEWIQTIER